MTKLNAILQFIVIISASLAFRVFYVVILPSDHKIVADNYHHGVTRQSSYHNVIYHVLLTSHSLLNVLSVFLLIFSCYFS